MASSYLAICSPSGLELLIPETPHAMRFVMRRVYDLGRSDEYCGWVIMADREASFVRTLIEYGYPEIASTVVHLLASEFGTLPPEFDEAARSVS